MKLNLSTAFLFLATLTLGAGGACGGDDSSSADGGGGMGGAGGMAGMGGAGGMGGGAGLVCDKSMFMAGADVNTPTSADLGKYAGKYAGDEGVYDDMFAFMKTGTFDFELTASGIATFKGAAVSIVSACLVHEKPAGGAPFSQLVLAFAKGHVDLTDKAELTGVSPADGMTILKGKKS